MNKYRQNTTVMGIFLLAAFVSTTLIYDLWQWHSDWRLIHQALPAMPQIPARPIINLDEIPNAHLFGKSLAKITEVPLSSLHLQVTGIVKIEGGDQNDQNKDSKVYISIGGQPSKIYRIGDNVSDDVKIDNITADTVILENNGRFEKLPLEREKLQFKPFIKKE